LLILNPSHVGGAAGGGITAAAFPHGLTLMIFICAYGSVSGGHMNPAVTVGVLAAGAITAAEAVGYIVSQIAGGGAAALLLRIVLGGVATGLGTPELAHGLVLGGTPVTITPAIGFMVEAVLASSWSRSCSAPRSPAAPPTSRRSRSA
jgi:glycerol uptake facilitator-like aquaporin